MFFCPSCLQFQSWGTSKGGPRKLQRSLWSNSAQRTTYLSPGWEGVGAVLRKERVLFRAGISETERRQDPDLPLMLRKPSSSECSACLGTPSPNAHCPPITPELKLLFMGAYISQTSLKFAV